MGSLSLTIQFTCRGLACHKANIADCYHLSSTLSAIISLLLRKKRDSVLACHKANIADCSHLSSTLSAILSLLLSKMERRLTRASKCVSVALFIFAAAFMVLVSLFFDILFNSLECGRYLITKRVTYSNIMDLMSNFTIPSCEPNVRPDFLSAITTFRKSYVITIR